MAKPTTTFTWALGPGAFTVTQPALPRRQSGWNAGEFPPAREMNWLLQSTGDWLTYLDDVHIDVTTDLIGGGTAGTNGLQVGNVGIGVESRPAAGIGVTTLRFTASTAVCVLKAEGFRAVGRYEFEDGSMYNAGALSLNLLRTPPISSPHAVHSWDVLTGGGGKVFVTQGGQAVNATPSEALAAGVGLDEGINADNILKAWARIRVARSGGVVTSCTLVGPSYNITSVAFDVSSGEVRVVLTSNTPGQIAGMVDVTMQHRGTVNGVAHPLACGTPVWNSADSRVEIVLLAQNTSTNVWYGINTATGTSGLDDMTVDITLRLY